MWIKRGTRSSGKCFLIIHNKKKLFFDEQEVVESVFLIIYNKKLFFDEQEAVETCTRRDFFFS